MGPLRDLFRGALGKINPQPNNKEFEMKTTVEKPETKTGCCQNKTAKPVDCCSEVTNVKCCKEETVRILAYLRWEKATGGNPVDDEQTKQFWLEAEKEVCSI